MANCTESTRFGNTLQTRIMLALPLIVNGTPSRVAGMRLPHVLLHDKRAANTPKSAEKKLFTLCSKKKYRVFFGAFEVNGLPCARSALIRERHAKIKCSRYAQMLCICNMLCILYYGLLLWQSVLHQVRSDGWWEKQFLPLYNQIC